MKKLITILSVIFALTLAASGLGVVFALPEMRSKVILEDSKPSAPAKPNGGPSGSGAVPLSELEYFELGDPFISNIMGTGKLFKITPVIAYRNVKRMDEQKLLNASIAPLRDYFLTRLRNISEDELRSPESMDNLRLSMAEALKVGYGLQFVETIYFVDFVIQ